MEDAQRAMDIGNYKQALTDLNKFLDRNPQDAQARFSKGLALVMLKRDDDAIKEFSDLARDFPELPESYNNLAVLYARAGRYEEARDALESALTAHPSYATAHENLGDIYAALANAAYNRAIVLDKNNAAVRNKQEMIATLIKAEANNVTTGRLPPTQMASAGPQAAPALPTPKPALAPVATKPTASSTTTTTPAIIAPPAPIAAAPRPNNRIANIEDIPETFSTTPILPGGASASSNSSQNISASDKSALLARVESWRSTWSAKDPDGYLANYSPNFDPATGVSRSVWESQRRTRVVRPRSILIQVVNPVVRQTGSNTAQVDFLQVYESNSYSDQVKKRLELERIGNKWLIVKESVIG